MLFHRGTVVSLVVPIAQGMNTKTSHASTPHSRGSPFTFAARSGLVGGRGVSLVV